MVFDKYNHNGRGPKQRTSCCHPVHSLSACSCSSPILTQVPFDSLLINRTHWDVFISSQREFNPLWRFVRGICNLSLSYRKSFTAKTQHHHKRTGPYPPNAPTTPRTPYITKVSMSLLHQEISPACLSTRHLGALGTRSPAFTEDCTRHTPRDLCPSFLPCVVLEHDCCQICLQQPGLLGG